MIVVMLSTSERGGSSSSSDTIIEFDGQPESRVQNMPFLRCFGQESLPSDATC